MGSAVLKGSTRRRQRHHKRADPVQIPIVSGAPRGSIDISNRTTKSGTRQPQNAEATRSPLRSQSFGDKICRYKGVLLIILVPLFLISFVLFIMPVNNSASLFDFCNRKVHRIAIFLDHTLLFSTPGVPVVVFMSFVLIIIFNLSTLEKIWSCSNKYISITISSFLLQLDFVSQLNKFIVWIVNSKSRV